MEKIKAATQDIDIQLLFNNAGFVTIGVRRRNAKGGRGEEGEGRGKGEEEEGEEGKQGGGGEGRRE